MLLENQEIWAKEYGKDNFYFKYKFIRFIKSYVHTHKGIETAVLVLQVNRLLTLPISLYDIRIEPPTEN